MRVLFALPLFPLPRDAGARIRIMEHIEVLAGRHEVMMVALVRGDESSSHLGELADFGSLVTVQAPHRRSPFHRVAYRAAYSLLGAIRSWPPDAFYGCPGPFWRTVVEESLKWGADVVHYDFWFSALYDLNPSPYRRVLLEHDIEYVRRRREAEQVNGAARARLMRIARQTEKLERRVLASVDCVLTVTPTDAQEAEQCGARRVLVLPTGVDTEQWNPPDEEPEDPVILFVGAFSHRPNVDAVQWFASSVFPRIRERHPAAVFRVVGSGAPPEVTALSNLPGVEVVGRVPEVVPYYTSSRVVVAPLRIGSGIKGKIVEAMAFGRPVVTTSIGAEGMDLTPGVNVFVQDSAEGFAEAVSLLLGHPEQARAVGLAGRALAEQRYSKRAARERIVQIYEEVASQEPPRHSPLAGSRTAG
ncbi:MAG: glycosyltransferase family 4 protein [Armatimonadota bacterium]